MSGKSGLNHAAKHVGKGVTKGASYSAPPEALVIVEEKGHYLHDPSSPSDPPGWLVESIDLYGVLQPIAVQTDGDQLLVARGRSRVRAARAVNVLRAERGEPLLRIPYVLADGTDEQLGEQVDAENFHRRQTGPVAQALAAAKYRARGYPSDKIAALVACDPRDLARIECIYRCCADVQHAIRDGKLDWRLAGSFADLSRAEQQERLRQMVATGATKGRKAREALKGKAPASQARPLPRKKLERLRDAMAAECMRVNDDTGTAALLADFCRLTLGDGKALDEWGEVRGVAPLIKVVRAALAPQKPGRKPTAKVQG